ncbi:predicted protein [Histoplasma capsulatum G186AR]|uniref:Uncharacterized protein n=1 Tax=Ajellomyces capsulatus (strain G186AR / H82 / ATCC MYA-2454 / RMSCC 2432) TaxID=447093 RepID=C0NXE0_AJECG|nr:uncharacterized protein HCBG_08132 [Histoplasma capsulatum G186AR]EEH04006.1 predicted protein [Histoplasma capsulatum G186AR]
MEGGKAVKSNPKADPVIIRTQDSENLLPVPPSHIDPDWKRLPTPLSGGHIVKPKRYHERLIDFRYPQAQAKTETTNMASKLDWIDSMSPAEQRLEENPWIPHLIEESISVSEIRSCKVKVVWQPSSLGLRQANSEQKSIPTPSE